MSLHLNALEGRLLSLYQSDRGREFTTYDLLVALECSRDSLHRARNKLWRAGLIEVGCRGKSKLKSEDQT